MQSTAVPGHVVVCRAAITRCRMADVVCTAGSPQARRPPPAVRGPERHTLYMVATLEKPSKIEGECEN